MLIFIAPTAIEVKLVLNLNKVKIRRAPIHPPSSRLSGPTELKVDKLFSMNQYSDQRKLDLAVIALDGYAATWWERCVQQCIERHEPRVVTCDELKR